MILAALALATSITGLDFGPPRPSHIDIAVASDGSVTITADGKPISCRQFNDYLVKNWKDRRPTPSLDCKTGILKNVPKQ